MAAKAKAKSKTGEKKIEYHLKDYLSMCKVTSQILDFRGLRWGWSLPPCPQRDQPRGDGGGHGEGAGDLQEDGGEGSRVAGEGQGGPGLGGGGQGEEPRTCAARTRCGCRGPQVVYNMCIKQNYKTKTGIRRTALYFY